MAPTTAGTPRRLEGHAGCHPSPFSFPFDARRLADSSRARASPNRALAGPTAAMPQATPIAAAVERLHRTMRGYYRWAIVVALLGGMAGAVPLRIALLR